VPCDALQVLFDGTRYAKVPVTAEQAGWWPIGLARTMEEADAMIQKDWDRYWNLCALPPSIPLTVLFAPSDEAATRILTSSPLEKRRRACKPTASTK
jgi:hypothetical protein